MAAFRGFTLIELLVCLSVMAILLTMGVPAFQRAQQNHRMEAEREKLMAHLALARSEAIKRSSTVVACKSAGTRSCVQSGGWESGWLVFQDLDGDRQCDDSDEDDSCADGGSVLLLEPSLDQPAFTLRATGNPEKLVVFNANGLAMGHAGTFSLCDGHQLAQARGVVISLIGRMRRTRTGDNVTCPP
jgi:type IV fimbrial biogenesis protein FimT